MISTNSEQNRKHWIPVAALIALVAALYFPVLGAGYIWDDIAFFTPSSDLRTGDVWRAATAPVISGTAYFRPLTMLWLIAEARLLDAQPLFSHLANLGLHLANTLLVGVLAKQLAQSQRAPSGMLPSAVIAMLIYGLHPALVEPVAWVSGRFDLMVTFFCLSGLALASRATWRGDCCCALLFLAAALSKEMAATFGVLLFLWLWAKPEALPHLTRYVRGTLQERKRIYLLLLAAGLVYLALRTHFMPQMLSFDPEITQQLGSFTRRGAYVGLTLDFYLRTVVFPFVNMGPLHPFAPATDLGLPQILQGWVTIALALSWLAFSVLRPTPARLLLTAALVSLLPVLNIAPLATSGNIGHERFLPLPLALFSLSVAPLAWRALSGGYRAVSHPRWRAWLGGLAALWLAAVALNIYVTVPLWKNELVFWSWVYRTHLDSTYAQFSLAAAAINAGRFDILQETMTKAEKMGVMPLKLTVPYAEYLARQGEVQPAINKIQLALKGTPLPHLEAQQSGAEPAGAAPPGPGFDRRLLVHSYDVLAQMQLSLRRFADALESTKTADFYEKNNPNVLWKMSFSLYGLNRFDEAEETYRKAESLYPANFIPEARKLRASFLRQLCGDESARQNLTCKKIDLTALPQERPAQITMP